MNKDTSDVIDPLRRIFVPIEKRNVHGAWVFKTSDGAAYVRREDGSIRRASPKVNGKQARQARRQQRVSK